MSLKFIWIVEREGTNHWVLATPNTRRAARTIAKDFSKGPYKWRAVSFVRATEKRSTYR